MRSSVCSLGTATTLAALALPAAARAQPHLDATLTATRRDLINQAVAARGAGDHARALDLAGRAGQIQMSPSLRRLLAEEEAAVGQLAPALGSAELCVQEARESTQPGVAAHRAACEALAADLRQRVGRVVVRVPEPAPAGLRVTVAGHELPRALWGVAYVVTPGTLAVEAQAPGYATFRRDVHVAGGASAEATVALATRGAEASAPARAAVEVDAGAGAGAGPRGERAAGQPFPAGPVVVMGVGAAGLVAAGVFAVLRGSALGQSAAACGKGAFDLCGEADVTTVEYDAARQHYDRALTYTVLTDVALGVGVAAVAGGALWLLFGPRERSPASPRATLLRVVPRSDGVVFGLGGVL